MLFQAKRLALVWALLLCIGLVNGFMAAPSVGHAEHHADHQAGTHSTGICAWLCAAGQDIQSVSAPLISEFQSVQWTVATRVDPVLTPGFFYHSFRGPPHFFS